MTFPRNLCIERLCQLELESRTSSMNMGYWSWSAQESQIKSAGHYPQLVVCDFVPIYVSLNLKEVNFYSHWSFVWVFFALTVALSLQAVDTLPRIFSYTRSVLYPCCWLSFFHFPPFFFLESYFYSFLETWQSSYKKGFGTFLS